MKLTLVLKDLVDRMTQRNFEQIQSAWNDNALSTGNLKRRDISILAASTDYKFQHNLGYTPRDVIVTSAIGLDADGNETGAFTGTVTWKYTQFDGTNLILTTSAAVKLRVLVGTLA